MYFEISQHSSPLSLVENIALLIIDCLRYSEGDLVLTLGVNNTLLESSEHTVSEVIDEQVLVSIQSQQIFFIRVDFEVQELHRLVNGEQFQDWVLQDACNGRGTLQDLFVCWRKGCKEAMEVVQDVR